MKDDGLHELTETTGHLQRRLDTVERKLSERKGDLKAVGGRLTKLEGKFGAHSIQTVLDKVTEVKKDFDRRLNAQSGEIVELRRNVDALHRKIRVSAGLPEADFHEWPQISREMIRLIRASLASAPVSPAKVQRLREEHERAQERIIHWDKALQEAVPAARALTELSFDAEGLWRREARMWRAFRRGGARPVDGEAQARQQYEEAVRAQESATVAAAKSAEADRAASAVIRDRVVDALARDFVTPQWFDTALGLFPPKVPDQIEAWLLAATRLIRYRLLAPVRDPLHPYGDRPADSTLAAEYDRVVRDCSNVRR